MKWIIGADSGIGAATVKELRRETDEYIYATGKDSCDVRSYHDLAETYSHIQAQTRLLDQPLTGIVYCAGVNELSWLAEMGPEDFEIASDVMGTNFMGFVRLLAIVAGDNERDKDIPIRIIAVSSDAAERPLRTSTTYCASKAALNTAVRTGARELASEGIYVTAVAPGMVAGTGMTEYIDKEVPLVRGWSTEEALAYEQQQEVTKGRIPKEDIARVIVDMLNWPKHFTGEIVTMNGGR